MAAMPNVASLIDVTRSDWGAAPPNRGYTWVDASARPGLEDHHSVGLYGVSPAGPPHPFMRQVQGDHLSRRWVDIFYNLCVWFDGNICEGRPLSATSRSERLLTILFPGNYCVRQLTRAQKLSWHKIRRAASQDGVGAANRWHAMRGGSACPCTNVISWKRAGHPVGGQNHDPVGPETSHVEEEDMIVTFTDDGRRYAWFLGTGKLKHLPPAGDNALRKIRNDENPDWLQEIGEQPGLRHSGFRRLLVRSN